nr:hypothetical protein WG33_0307 [uncultured bacterium]
MRRIAGEDHGASLSVAAYRLQAGCVPVAQSERYAGRELVVAVVEHHVIGIETAHELRDRFAVERRAHLAIANLAPGGEGHLGVLHVETGVGKGAESAGVVVVKMGEDHVLDREVVDPGVAQTFDHRPGDGSPARRRGTLAKAGIDDHRRRAVAVDRPDEVIERHRHIVVVDRAREVDRRAPLVPGVADRVDAGDGGRHALISSHSSFPRKREPRGGKRRRCTMPL